MVQNGTVLNGLHRLSALALVCRCVPSVCFSGSIFFTDRKPGNSAFSVITLTPPLIKCDKMEGGMRKKIGLRLCQLLHSPVSLSLLLFIIIFIRCVSCVAHLLTGGDGRAGQFLNLTSPYLFSAV